MIKYTFLEIKYFVLGSIIAGIIFPVIADFYGRKNTMILASALGGISTLACGVAPTMNL
jgi:MFS family permease